MPTIHTRPFRIEHKSTFITGDSHYVLLYKISFRTDPVNLFWVVFLMQVLKRRFIAWFYTILFISTVLLCNFYVPYLLGFAAAILSVREVSNLPSLWLCRALRQTIIFCIAICRLPLQMIDILNKMSGPHINRQTHSGVLSHLPPGLKWNNICLLHQGLVYSLPRE